MKKFIGLYYEWGSDKKVLYKKMTIEKYVKKLLECYKKHTGGDVKVQKKTGSPGKILINIDLEKPQDTGLVASNHGNLYVPLLYLC